MNPYDINDAPAFQMLILSDLHYECKRKEDFEKVFNPFLKTLSNFLKKNKEWTPQCLALIGDIVHNENNHDGYDEVRSFIKKMELELGKTFYIVTVPGNHDKQLTPPSSIKIEDGEKGTGDGRKITEDEIKIMAGKIDLEAAEDFLRIYTSHKPENCQKASDYLEQYFGQYARFASLYHKEKERMGKWFPVPDTKVTEELSHISGYYLMEREKVCIVALNTEWKYVAKNAGKNGSIITLGKDIIKQMEIRVKKLKREGYLIITLMHRSPYTMCWNDIYGSLEENSLVERLVGMSDLIVCGHEHNAKNREPDMLMNSTLLYQNGIMFDREKNDGRYPYSASLIRIDTKAHMLHVIRLRFNNEDALTYEWSASTENMKTYCMEPIASPQKILKTSGDGQYKAIPFYNPIDNDMLHKKLRSLFYGETSPDKIPPYIKCHIMELSKDTDRQIDDEIGRIKQTETADQPSQHKLHTFLLYSKRSEGNNFELQTQKAIQLYKDIKKRIKKTEIGHKIVTNLIFCDILI